MKIYISQTETKMILIFRFEYFNSYPIAYDSPFLKHVNKVLFELERSGLMTKIKNRYKARPISQCSEGKVIYF